MERFIIIYLSTFLCSLLTIPFIIFFHELGHAVFMLFFSKGKVHILIGDIKIHDIQLRIGRLEIGFNKLYKLGGLAIPVESVDTKVGRLLAYAGGPIVSLLMVLSLLFSFFIFNNLWAKCFIIAILNYSIIQLLFTSIPIRYKKGVYRGMYSDGFMILRIIKE